MRKCGELLDKYVNLYFDSLVKCNELKLQLEKLQFEKDSLEYENHLLNFKIRAGYESEELDVVYPCDNY
jgi:hypothetical protein